MGRAIDMQNDIEVLKREIEKLNNIVRGMASELSEVTEVVFEEEEIIEEKKDGKKKANTKRTGKSDESSDTADGSADTESK